VAWCSRTIGGVIRVLLGLLIAFVVAYTIFGAMLAFNVRGTADRVSRISFDRTIWRRNNKPSAWRTAGFIIVAIGLLTLALLAATVK
jgi:hypothetical protein